MPRRVKLTLFTLMTLLDWLDKLTLTDEMTPIYPLSSQLPLKNLLNFCDPVEQTFCAPNLHHTFEEFVQVLVF